MKDLAKIERLMKVLLQENAAHRSKIHFLKTVPANSPGYAGLEEMLDLNVRLAMEKTDKAPLEDDAPRINVIPMPGLKDNEFLFLKPTDLAALDDRMSNSIPRLFSSIKTDVCDVYDAWQDLWIENDAHLRQRLKELSKVSNYPKPELKCPGCGGHLLYNEHGPECMEDK